MGLGCYLILCFRRKSWKIIILRLYTNRPAQTPRSNFLKLPSIFLNTVSTTANPCNNATAFSLLVLTRTVPSSRARIDASRPVGDTKPSVALRMRKNDVNNNITRHYITLLGFSESLNDQLQLGLAVHLILTTHQYRRHLHRGKG